jgi:hypothetical protein
LLDVSKIAFVLAEKKGLNFKSVMQKTQKCHGQAHHHQILSIIDSNKIQSVKQHCLIRDSMSINIRHRNALRLKMSLALCRKFGSPMIDKGAEQLLVGSQQLN